MLTYLTGGFPLKSEKSLTMIEIVGVFGRNEFNHNQRMFGAYIGSFMHFSIWDVFLRYLSLYI